jgi:hypothetical protein
MPPSPLYNSAKVLPLGPVGRDAFSRYLSQRFNSTSLSISDDAIIHLLDITAGHPHDAQKLAYFTWAMAEADDTRATPDTVERAFASAIAADTARYTELWDGLTFNQRRLLEALGRAAPSEEVLSEEFRRRNRLAPTRPLSGLLTHLRGLVDAKGGPNRSAGCIPPLVAMPGVTLRLQTKSRRSLCDSGQELFDRKESQSDKSAVEIAGVEHGERMVDNIAECGPMGDTLVPRIVADEALCAGGDSWGCFLEYFLCDGVRPGCRWGVADRTCSRTSAGTTRTLWVSMKIGVT